MIKFYFIIFVLVLYNFGSNFCKKSCKKNDDCIVIESCPGAATLVKYRKINATIDKSIKSSICGSKLVGGNITVQVCCSDFDRQESITHPIINHRAIGEKRSSPMSDNDFINHNNMGLLPENCGKYLEDRIVGGEFAHIYEFPWMALISYIDNDNIYFGCGGTIINYKYILTAGHCVYHKNIKGVRLGEYDIRTELDCEGEYETIVCENHLQDLEVESKIIHENYYFSWRISYFDIALLRVASSINFVKNVAPICLPIFKEHQTFNFMKKDGIVAGWGATETASPSMILKKTSVRVHSVDTSKENQQTILAGNVGRDSCFGDSGGPLMFSDQYNRSIRMVQYGIVSYGPSLCGSSYPSTYTDVRKYTRWILDNIRE